MKNNRWKCPKCGSLNVAVCYPAWFKEACDRELQYIEADIESDVKSWHCEDCNGSDSGAPTNALKVQNNR